MIIQNLPEEASINFWSLCHPSVCSLIHSPSILWQICATTLCAPYSRCFREYGKRQWFLSRIQTRFEIISFKKLVLGPGRRTMNFPSPIRMVWAQFAEGHGGWALKDEYYVGGGGVTWAKVMRYSWNIPLLSLTHKEDCRPLYKGCLITLANGSPHIFQMVSHNQFLQNPLFSFRYNAVEVFILENLGRFLSMTVVDWLEVTPTFHSHIWALCNGGPTAPPIKSSWLALVKRMTKCYLKWQGAKVEPKP